MRIIKEILPKTIVFFLMLTILCGVVYPLTITAVAGTFFHDKANGSIFEIDGKKYGSELLGQEYTDVDHLWGRIMNIDTGTFKDKDGKPLMYSVPSNLSPASDEYDKLIKERIEKIKAAHPGSENKKIPVDLVTVSGSGLDPHISLSAAEYQIDRIVANTDYSEAEVRKIIEKYTTGRLFGVFGEPVVNVLQVNLALDGIL